MERRQGMNNNELCNYNMSVALKVAGFDWPVANAFSQKIRLEPFSMGNLKAISCKSPKNFNDNRKGLGEDMSPKTHKSYEAALSNAIVTVLDIFTPQKEEI